jgi:hypothetical protein
MESSMLERWSETLGLNHTIPGAAPFVRPVVWLFQLAVRSSDDPSKWEDLLLFVVIYGSSLLYENVSVPIEHLWRAGIALLISFGSGLLILTLVALGRSKYNVKVRKWEKSVDCTKPLILPCRTNHSRTFPQKHSFGYQYLQVSIPVPYEGNHGLISVGKSARWSLFRVNPTDHLQRSCQSQTLKERLDAYLKSEVSNFTLNESY